MATATTTHVSAGARSSGVTGDPLLPPPVAPARPAPPLGDIDAALKERLDRLATARSGAGRNDVPPTARTNRATPKRRHPAKHSRTAALGLSVLASGGLGFWFSSSDPGTTAPVATSGIVTTSPLGTSTAATSTATATAGASAELSPAAAQEPVQEDIVVASAEPRVPDATAAPEPPTTAAEVIVAAEPVTINGANFTNKWGDVQVQATFAADGTLTDVTMLQVPFRDDKSVRINDRAVPVLNSEALSAQSAQIDTVSGATYTSVGYKQSLQSAIDIAIANGIAVGTSS